MNPVALVVALLERHLGELRALGYTHAILVQSRPWTASTASALRGLITARQGPLKRLGRRK